MKLYDAFKKLECIGSGVIVHSNKERQTYYFIDEHGGWNFRLDDESNGNFLTGVVNNKRYLQQEDHYLWKSDINAPYTVELSAAP